LWKIRQRYFSIAWCIRQAPDPVLFFHTRRFEMKQKVLSVFFVITLALSLCGCGPTLPPKLGHYIGNVNNQYFISFDVGASGIEDLFMVMEYKNNNGGVNTQETCTIKDNMTENITIPINPDGTFSDKSDSVAITGKISGSEVSGNYTTTLCGDGSQINGKWNANYDQPLIIDVDDSITFLKTLGFHRNTGLESGQPRGTQVYTYGSTDTSNYMEISIDGISTQTFKMSINDYLNSNNKDLFKSVIAHFYPPAIVDWIISSSTDILGNSSNPNGEKAETVDGFYLHLKISEDVNLFVQPSIYK
jgi:hypothetical protein